MKVKLVIGDWSHDGHGQSEFVYFEVTHGVEEIRKAYKQAVKTSGITFYKERHTDRPVEILRDFEDDKIGQAEVDRLRRLGVDWRDLGEENDDGSVHMRPQDAARLFMEMVRTQLPGFGYTLVVDDTPCVNGFWQKEFNISIGYGCYSA